MFHRDFFVKFDELKVQANDEILEARVENQEDFAERNYKSKHFQLKYDDATGLITELYTQYDVLMAGKLANYEDNCVIVDYHNGDVYTLEELFLEIFES